MQICKVLYGPQVVSDSEVSRGLNTCEDPTEM